MLTTEQVLTVTGVSRMQLKHLRNQGALVPAVPGSKGRGLSSQYTIQQTLAIAYAAAMRRAGCHGTWTFAAVNWLSRLDPGAMHAAFAEGRTLLSVSPHAVADAQLVRPHLPPTASRADRIMLAQLNVQSVEKEVLRRTHELLGKLYAQEQHEVEVGTK